MNSGMIIQKLALILADVKDTNQKANVEILMC